MGVTLASSVTSTLAWYQYSTSSAVSYTGTTVGCSKLLKISNDNGSTWKTDLVLDDSETPSYSPVTSGAILSNAALTKLYGAPSYLKEAQSDWGDAPVGSYKEFTFQIKFADVSGENEVLDSGTIYLTDLTITDNNANLDLENAVRVHFNINNGTSYRLYSLAGSDTNVCGKLDLNNDGKYDQKGYEFQTKTDVNYGGTGQVQKSLASSGVATTPVELGTIDGDTLTIKVTIWIEGWALLGTGLTGNKETSNTAVWNNATYSAKDFHVGMTFGIEE